MKNLKCLMTLDPVSCHISDEQPTLFIYSWLLIGRDFSNLLSKQERPNGVEEKCNVKKEGLEFELNSLELQSGSIGLLE